MTEVAPGDGGEELHRWEELPEEGGVSIRAGGWLEEPSGEGGVSREEE